MKNSLLTGIVFAAITAFTNQSHAAITNIKACKPAIQIDIIKYDDHPAKIRTVSPLGHPRLWDLEKDFVRTTDGVYENFLMQVFENEGQLSIHIKNGAMIYNCTK